MPFLLAQLSDSHVRVGSDDQTAARSLEEAVRSLMELDPLPDAVLVSGDLAEHGSAAEYERVRELLAPLSMPVHVMPGNHDDRDALRAAFGDDSITDDLFRYAVRCGPLRLVVCDTTLPGLDRGSMDADRLAWLEAQLAADRETPTIVAMHHAPLLTGIPEMDEIGLPAVDRAALGELLTRHPQVQRIVGGHVHRTVTAELGGRQVFACPSTYLQALLDFAGRGPLELVPEPPGYALHLALDGELITHVQPVVA